MRCQLVSMLEAGRRTRGARAYPEIWGRAVSRYMRWYFVVAGRAIGGLSSGGGGRSKPASPTGDERRLAAGDWVRVKSRAEIEALQREADPSDIVAFITAPMSRYCGRTLRVLRVLENYYDEVRAGLCEAENAVLLDGATCDSSQLGNRHCDRKCLHFWKEAWLERVAAPEPGTDREGPKTDATDRTDAKRHIPTSSGQGLRAGTPVRVRDLASIEKTLDERDTLEGVSFVREHMAAYCGRFFLVDRKISQFFDERSDYMVRLPRAYLLAGVRCDGRQSGGNVHCDRKCALAWHEAWLECGTLEPVSEADGRPESAQVVPAGGD